MPPSDLWVIEPGAVIVSIYAVKSMLSGLLTCSGTGCSKNFYSTKNKHFSFQLKDISIEKKKGGC
jgi:hypothetical protein